MPAALTEDEVMAIIHDLNKACEMIAGTEATIPIKEQFYTQLNKVRVLIDPEMKYADD